MPNTIPIDNSDYNVSTIGAGMLTRYVLEYKLLISKAPFIWRIWRSSNVVASHQEIQIPSSRGPGIEGKRDLAWELLENVSDSFDCLVRMLDNLFLDFVTTWDVHLFQRWMFKVEQSAGWFTFIHPNGLEIELDCHWIKLWS